MSLSGFLLFLVLACVTFRLAELVVFDNAPGDVLLRLRTWTGLYDMDANGEPFLNANALQRWLGGILDCPHCAGVYFAFGGAAVWLWLLARAGEFQAYPALALGVLFVVVWLGLAGLQSFLESGWGRSNP